VTGDGQASTGQVPYEPSRCRRSHLDTLHKPHATTGVRGACSASTCPCKTLATGETS
jgi:hypothetical protein